MTDAGLVHLPVLKELRFLQLRGSPGADSGVTGASLVNLRGLTQLKTLWLAYVPVTDSDLSHLKALSSLEGLEMARCRIKDAGVIHLSRYSAI